MNGKRYWIAILCLCLLLCGCAATDHEESSTYTTTVTKPSETEDTADEWNELLSYEEYMALSAADRSAFVDSFETTEDFISWLNAVKKIYDSEQTENVIGNDGVINMEGITP